MLLKLTPSVAATAVRLFVRTRCSVPRFCEIRSSSFTTPLRTFTTSRNSASRQRPRRRDASPPVPPIAIVPPLSIDEFQALVTRDAASAAHALACMKKHREEIELLPMSDRKAACVRAAVGSRMFAWMLEKNRQAELDTMFTSSIAIPLLICWHMIGEGLEDYIWRYLEVVDKEQLQHARGDKLSHAVRLLGDLAKAHWEWSEQNSAEPALQVLERALETLPFASRFTGVSFVALRMVLCRVIQSATCPPYPSRYFELYTNNLDRTQAAQEFSEDELARIMLYHPTQPDADPLLRLVRHNHEMWKAKPPALTVFGINMYRACYIFEHQGRMDDSSWLKDIIEARTPQIWRMRHRLRWEFDNDPKLANLRQQSRSQTLKVPASP